MVEIQLGSRLGDSGKLVLKSYHSLDNRVDVLQSNSPAGSQVGARSPSSWKPLQLQLYLVMFRTHDLCVSEVNFAI